MKPLQMSMILIDVISRLEQEQKEIMDKDNWHNLFEFWLWQAVQHNQVGPIFGATVKLLL